MSRARPPLTVDPEHLAEVPFFALLDEAQRALLAARVETTTAPAGHMMFGYGDPGDSLYIVRSGVVEIFSKNDTGERIVLETARAGDFFGEISLLDGGPRTASAVVVEDLDAVVVDRSDLEEFLRIVPGSSVQPAHRERPQAPCVRRRNCCVIAYRATSTRSPKTNARG